MKPRQWEIENQTTIRKNIYKTYKWDRGTTMLNVCRKFKHKIFFIENSAATQHYPKPNAIEVNQLFSSPSIFAACFAQFFFSKQIWLSFERKLNDATLFFWFIYTYDICIRVFVLLLQNMIQITVSQKPSVRQMSASIWLICGWSSEAKLTFITRFAAFRWH